MNTVEGIPNMPSVSKPSGTIIVGGILNMPSVSKPSGMNTAGGIQRVKGSIILRATFLNL